MVAVDSEICQVGNQSCMLPMNLYDLLDLRVILSRNDNLTDDDRSPSLRACRAWTRMTSPGCSPGGCYIGEGGVSWSGGSITILCGGITIGWLGGLFGRGVCRGSVRGTGQNLLSATSIPQCQASVTLIRTIVCTAVEALVDILAPESLISDLPLPGSKLSLLSITIESQAAEHNVGLWVLQTRWANGGVVLIEAADGAIVYKLGKGW